MENVCYNGIKKILGGILVENRRKSDIAIGNIVGSNIFNMLLIIGVAATIKPITYNIKIGMLSDVQKNAH